jgi:hypothetical protein
MLLKVESDYCKFFAKCLFVLKLTRCGRVCAMQAKNDGCRDKRGQCQWRLLGEIYESSFKVILIMSVCFDLESNSGG